MSQPTMNEKAAILIEELTVMADLHGSNGDTAAAEEFSEWVDVVRQLVADLDCPFRLARHSKRLIEQLREESEALRKDAGRWRAFISCARIKFFGWAGYGEKDPYGNSPGNYRHFGGEFWTIHDAPTADKEKAAEILNGFADAAVAAMSKGEQP